MVGPLNDIDLDAVLVLDYEPQGFPNFFLRRHRYQVQVIENLALTITLVFGCASIHHGVITELGQCLKYMLHLELGDIQHKDDLQRAFVVVEQLVQFFFGGQRGRSGHRRRRGNIVHLVLFRIHENRTVRRQLGFHLLQPVAQLLHVVLVYLAAAFVSLQRRG